MRACWTITATGPPPASGTTKSAGVRPSHWPIVFQSVTMLR